MNVLNKYDVYGHVSRLRRCRVGAKDPVDDLLEHKREDMTWRDRLFGDYGYEVGKYALSDDAGKVSDRGKYIVVWKKVRGRWMLYRDIFNSDLPPPAA